MAIDLGNVALVLAFIVAVYTVAGSFLGILRHSEILVISARYLFYSIPLFLLISAFSLVYAFVGNDFSVKYVAENSNLAMPSEYAWVAFYAGNSGSLLFLVLVFSILATIAIYTLRKRLPVVSHYSVGLMGFVITFFVFVMLFFANPLERLPITPNDGQGINPLLIHFGMFIHPPVLMTGLVSITIPFSISMGVLMSGQGGEDSWIDIGRIWAMLSWVVLTLGLLMGSWWAYTILGWGGYWAWDPVENSGLMPWLILTAFVHSIMVQKRRGMFRMWNMVLIILAFSMAQLGMFINRGGPVPSVHSFAQSSMGWLFLGFMVFTFFISIAIFCFRVDTLKSSSKLDSIVSRESVFLFQNVLFIIVALVTLWGTIFPVFSETIDDTVMTIGRPFFDKVNGPILLAIILLMGIGPLLPWRKSRFKILFNVLKVPLFFAFVLVVILLFLGVMNPLALFAFAICSLSVTGIFYEWVKGTRVRHGHGENWVVAYMRLLLGNRPRYGGYIIHLGIVMLAIGIIGSSFYDFQKDFVLSPGDSAQAGDYSFKYLDVTTKQFSDREEQIARFEVSNQEQRIGILSPFRSFYPEKRISATRGAIHSTLLEDFYIVASEISENKQGVFRVYINPLVWWMWLSGPIIFFGAMFAISPMRIGWIKKKSRVVT